MKGRHWFNLIVCASVAAACAVLGYRWGVSSYAEPTCRAYGEARGRRYVRFVPPDWSHKGGGRNAGSCRYLTADGREDRESLYTASGKDYGAPLLVTFALRPDLVFFGAFVGAALLLAVVSKGRKDDAPRT